MEQLAHIKLLKDVIEDNPTFNFPIELIRSELTFLVINSLEFDYFMMRIYTKLEMTYGRIYGQIFLDVINRFTNYTNTQITQLDESSYSQCMDSAITFLEGIKVTRIDKNTPDGEMLLLMTKQHQE
jgi:hypothetical protein